MIKLIVLRDDEVFEFDVPAETNLRRWLLAHHLTPYVWVARQVNCGGRGLCATCGVGIIDDVDDESDEPAPTHWHDKLAKRFGYPRLSCQIRVSAPLTIRILTEKRLWGGRHYANCP